MLETTMRGIFLKQLFERSGEEIYSSWSFLFLIFSTGLHLFFLERRCFVIFLPSLHDVHIDHNCPP